MKLMLVGLFGLLLLTSSGCSYLFYPHAKEFTEKAKGTNTVETLINLTTMMEASAKAGQNGRGDDQAFDDLHNQLHAFDNTRHHEQYECQVKHQHQIRAQAIPHEGQSATAGA